MVYCSFIHSFTLPSPCLLLYSPPLSPYPTLVYCSFIHSFTLPSPCLLLYTPLSPYPTLAYCSFIHSFTLPSPCLLLYTPPLPTLLWYIVPPFTLYSFPLSLPYSSILFLYSFIHPPLSLPFTLHPPSLSPYPPFIQPPPSLA